MRHFNLVKSLTRVNNIITLPFREGLGVGRMLILCLSLAVFGVDSAWGNNHYSRARARISSNSTGKGMVYVAQNSTSYDDITGWKADKDETSSDKNEEKPTYYFYAKSETGYHFLGWSTTDNGSTYESQNTSWKCDNVKIEKNDATYWVERYANFAANTNTAYTVKHCKQNVAGTGYDLAETDNLIGTTDTKVTPARKSYTGFTAPAGKEVTIKGDGTASVSYNYTRNSYTLTWDLDGGSITTAGTPAGSVKYGATLTAPEVSKAGAQFNGWSPEVPSTMPAQNVTYTAQWVTKYDFEMSGEDRSMKVDEELPNAFTFTHADNPVAHISNTNVVTYDATNNKLIAHQEGTATIYFTQTATKTIQAGTSDTYTITVSKIANTLSVADASPSMKVEEQWGSVISGKNSDASVTTTSSDATVAYYDVASNKIVAQNTGNQSFNSKEVTITISQEETYKYTAAEKTITVTVNKHDNHISINGSQDGYQASIYMDAQQAINLTATNTDYSGSPITATQTVGNTIATLNAEQTQVTSNHNLGDATWTVSQPENYKYKAANASFTIHVVKEAEATNCYVLEDNSEHKFTTGALDFNGHFDTPLAINGPACQLTFEAKKDKAGANQFVAQYSIDNGNNWTDVNMPDLSDSYQKPFGPFNIPDNATHIRFGAKTGGTLSKYYRNVRVTRKTYLETSDFTIDTQENNTTLVYPGDKGTGSFHVDYSLANGGDLKIVCDNPKFTIDKTTQIDVDCKSGSFDVKMTYTSQTAGEDYAHVVIYNNVYRKEITVTGITQKHQQTLKWKENFDQMSKGGEEKNAATSSHGLVTYISSKPGVIRVDNDANGNATILVAIDKGEAEITATAAGDDEYEEKSIKKTISVTEKCVQYIVWTQSLMGLKLGDPNRVLNAYATSEIEECTSNNGGRLVTYTSADESVVKVVNTNQLQIVGVGTTTVTAHQAGGLDSDGHEYETATKENTVVVKNPSAKCEAFVYEQNGDAEQFFQMNTNEITGTEHTLSGEPAKITFRAKREYWNLAVNYSKGNIVLDAYTPTGGWQQVLDCGEPPIGSYKEYSKELSRDVTRIRFRRPSGGQGYHYIADAKVEMLRYIETSTPSTFQANVGEVQQQTIYLNYSNITDHLLLSMAGGVNSHFSVDKTQIPGNCGDVDKNIALTISYAPTTNTEELGEETETLIISDGTTITNVALKGVANRVARSIAWNINDQNTAYTVQTIELNAIAETNLLQKAGMVAYNIVSQTSTEGCGTINNNVLSFTKAGNVSVVATTIEDPKYFPATAVTKSWTVSKTPTMVTTKPSISTPIVSGSINLSDIVLEGGAAQNTINNQAVAGTFAVTAGDLVNVGEQTLTITFMPNNTDMYEGCTTTITATIVPRTPTIKEIGTPSATAIVYGNAVNTSALSGNGTLDGTWSWTDTHKDDVLNAGTYDDLAVHFTPDNKNYTEADATVSLTVYRATPTLTWTAEHATAKVHETKTFTAESTNTKTAITYSIVSGDDCATINETTGEVTMTKAGTITIKASQAETTNYNAVNIETTCTISVAPTIITTAPTTDNIVSGTSLSEVILNGGVAQNTINHQAVDGTFIVTDGDLVSVGEQTLTITFAPTNTDMYEGCTTTITATIVLLENRFTGDGGWNNASNWTNGIPTEENPNVVISGSLTITEPISVGDLTIENTGKVNIVNNGDLTINGTSDDRETYGNLFVRNGGNITINESANVKVFDFVVESSIGTEGTSISGQVKNSDRVIYTNGAYIDIYMDPEGEMDDTQWYGFTVPFPVDVQNGIARKEGDVFRKCTYGVEYFIAEYDMTQRLNSGKGWKYIKSGRLQPGRFYYFTVNGNYNVYSFKAADNTITIHNETQLVVNGEGLDANWNAVGNSTLTYTTISGENVPNFVQTYINGESRYMTVETANAQFVVGCPFFFQATQEATMILNEANETIDIHYAPRQESLDKPVCVRIAEEGKHFSDQIYLTASQETTGKYTLGRDLAKAGIGTKSAQLWINAYNQKLSVHEATLMGEQAYYELSIYAPKAGSYELSLPKVPVDATIFLIQNGYPIWNLNESPYVIECNKGTSNEYGLLLQLQESSTPTNMQTMRGSENVQKILKDQRIYINANTQLYDLMGQKVK